MNGEVLSVLVHLYKTSMKCNVCLKPGTPDATTRMLATVGKRVGEKSLPAQGDMGVVEERRPESEGLKNGGNLGGVNRASGRRRGDKISQKGRLHRIRVLIEIFGQ